MRIISYTTHLDEDRKPMLVKERAINYVAANRLDSPQKIADMLNAVYNANVLTEEHVWMIAFNAKCYPVGVFEVSHGLMDATMIGPREVFMKLCLCGATCFALAHNHPSQDVNPSREDTEVTIRMKKAGEIMGIDLLDHIIIGGGYYSFKENRNVISGG